MDVLSAYEERPVQRDFRLMRGPVVDGNGRTFVSIRVWKEGRLPSRDRIVPGPYAEEIPKACVLRTEFGYLLAKDLDLIRTRLAASLIHLVSDGQR
ncbi:MAG TPA: hypothetical protein VN886_04830 [Acidimicrobiales bacterium]|jgi:hypothetical protein|nr:hypothetical protein [Acidimicrobiales bacterium]